MTARIDELERRLASAEAELQRYRQIVESTSDGIVKVDAGGDITFANLRLCEMLGYGEQELLGRSLFSFMDAESEALARETREKRIQGVRNVIDLSFRGKHGGAVSLSLSGAPIFDDEKRYVGALAIVRDVTEQKTMAARLTMSDRLASVGTLAAGVAHEINNPLAIVVANLNHIATTLPESGSEGNRALGDVDGPIAEARAAAERVRVIVRDLMLFSRSSESTPPSPVELRGILEASIRMVMHEIRPRARLVESYGAVRPVLADESRLGQVFLGLLVNAAQAITEGKSQENEISVTTRQDGPRVIVEVRDTGTGIKPAILGRIFDAFYTTKPVGVGTGLGLAIAHRIVEGLGGELTVRSAVGEGSTFTVSLPAA